jgi:hypothetical protein
MGGIVSFIVFRREEPLVKVMFGGVFGLFMLMWLPALFSFIFGFTILTQLLAAAVCAAGGTVCYIKLLKPQNSEKTQQQGRKNNKSIKQKQTAAEWFLNNKWFFITVLPIFILCIFLLHTHILRVSDTGGLNVGQSTYGDLQIHAGFITSVSEQTKFPPAYNILGGSTALGYPFLCDTVSSTFFTLGSSLRFSYILPMALAFAVVISAVFLFFRDLFGSDKKAAFCSWLFLIGGGFGFVYFFDLSNYNPGKITDMMTAFYHTPTNHLDYNLRWVNIIADMFIPQRATLFGYSILIPCLFLLSRAVFTGENKKYFIPLGIMAGGLPIIHTHSFLALGCISAVLLLYVLYKTVKDKDKNMSTLKFFLLFGIIAVVLALPQLIAFTFQQTSTASGFLRIHFNWINEMDNYFWFYIKNFGLIYILAVPAFLYANTKQKLLCAGGLFLWTLSEIIEFQPNNYDNNKLIFIAFFFLCGISGNFIIGVTKTLKDAKVKGTMFVFAIVFVVCNTSGVMTLAREVKSDYQAYSADEAEAGAFIRENTDPHGLFLTADNHNNTAAALGGRNIVCGSATFLYYHGLDYTSRKALAVELLQSPTLESLRENKIAYVYISGYERALEGGVNESFFENSLNKIFSNASVSIYKVD